MTDSLRPMEASLEALAGLFPTQVNRRAIGVGALGRYGQAEDTPSEAQQVEELMRTFSREVVVQVAKRLQMESGLWHVKTLRARLVMQEERKLTSRPSDVHAEAATIVARYGFELVGASLGHSFKDQAACLAAAAADVGIAIDICEWESQRVIASGDARTQSVGRTASVGARKNGVQEIAREGDKDEGHAEEEGETGGEEQEGGLRSAVALPHDPQALFGRSGWAKENRDVILQEVASVPYDPAWGLTKTQQDAYDRAAGTVRFLSRLTVHMACLIGQALNDARTNMPHGMFRWYLEHKLQLTKSTAANYMRLAKAFHSSQDIGHLSLGVVYKLAAKRVSVAVREAAITAGGDDAALALLRKGMPDATPAPEGVGSSHSPQEGVSTLRPSVLPPVVSKTRAEGPLSQLAGLIAGWETGPRREQAEAALQLLREALQES